MNTLRSLLNLRREHSGVTAIEFALIAPVFLLTLMGICDIGFNMYANTLLQGSLQKAARDSTIEGASTAVLDARVTDMVHHIVPNAALTFSRRAYADYSSVGQPEDFTDLNEDGACNDGEPYEDANGNGAYDTDRGAAGIGGARLAVLYEVSMSYPRIFPMAQLAGQSGTVTINAATVLRNQPYSSIERTLETRSCG